MVIDKCNFEMIKKMYMKYVFNFKEVLEMVNSIVGKESKVVVIFDGVLVIVK